MFILKMSQTWILIIVYILFVMGTTIMFTTLGYTILMLSFGRKSFYFHISLLMKLICDMRQTQILIIISILIVMGTIIMFPSLGYIILMLWLGKKGFLSTIFLIIKFSPSNESNMHSHNNLHSFCNQVLQSCSLHQDTQY